MVNKAFRNFVVFLLIGLLMATIIRIQIFIGLPSYTTVFGLILLPVLILKLLLPGIGAVIHRRTGITARATLPSFIIGFVALVALEALANPTPPSCTFVVNRPCLQPFHFALAAYGASLVGLTLALANWPLYRKIKTATSIEESQSASTLHYTEGTISSSNTITGPISDEQTVLFQTSIQSDAPLALYVEEDSTSNATDFTVTSGPNSTEVEISKITPYDFTAYANVHTKEHEHHRSQEWHYRPGNQVTVIGERTTPQNRSNSSRLRASILSNCTYTKLREQQKRRFIVPLLIGTLGTIISYLAMFATG